MANIPPPIIYVLHTENIYDKETEVIMLSVHLTFDGAYNALLIAKKDNYAKNTNIQFIDNEKEISSGIYIKGYFKNNSIIDMYNVYDIVTNGYIKDLNKATLTWVIKTDLDQINYVITAKYISQ